MPLFLAARSSAFRQSQNLLSGVRIGAAGNRAFSISAISRSTEYSNFASTTRKVICIGRNYVDHIKELGNTAGKEPFFFLKPPSSILEPGAGPVLLPRGVNTHFEIELGLVIGAELKDLSKDDRQKALDSVAGYFLAIDMTARNIQEHNKKTGLPWTTAKGFDTYLPVSKYIAKSKIKNPEDIELRLAVNGNVKQQDNTNLMIYKIAVRGLSYMRSNSLTMNSQCSPTSHQL